MRSIRVKVPVAGLVVESGELTEWHIAVGDEVRAGEELCTLEFEKVDFAVEAPSDGRVVELLVDAGSELAPGTQICVLEVRD